MALLQQQPPKGQWFFIDFEDEDGTVYEVEVEVVGPDGLPKCAPIIGCVIL